MNPIEAVTYLAHQWWFWVGAIGWLVLWMFILIPLLERHYYKQEDGKLFVKEGILGEWEEIGQHMKQKHGKD